MSTVVYHTFVIRAYQHIVAFASTFVLGMEGCGFGPNTLDTSLPPSQPWSHLADAFGIYYLPITPGPQVGLLIMM